MGEHRERTDKRMSQEVIRQVIIPLALKNLGARYIVKPYMGEYNDEDKTIKWGLGHKKHGDKRHRTGVTFKGIHYRDGKTVEGDTRAIEVDRTWDGLPSMTTGSCRMTRRLRKSSCRLRRRSTRFARSLLLTSCRAFP